MPHRARRILTALLLSIAAPSMAAAEPSPAEPSPYAALAGAEARVAAIGFRLTTENAPWCPARQPQFGWIWGDPRRYDADHRAEDLGVYGAAAHAPALFPALEPSPPAASMAIAVGTPVPGLGRAPVTPDVGDPPYAELAATTTPQT